MIRFACPGCGATYTVGDEKSGKTGKCPKCESQFVIPEPAAEVPPPLPISPTPSVDPNAPVEIVPCPSCQSRLSVAASDLGVDVECPHCQAIYPAVRAGDKRPPKNVIPEPVVKPSQRAAALRDEPKSNRYREDDDNERPSRRRNLRDDDEDDVPVSRRRSRDEDDEDDDRPRKKKRKSRTSGIESKRVMAGVLALLLGGFGVHKFYLGYTTTGIIYLLLCCTGVTGMLALVDGIIYLTKTDEEFIEMYQINQKEWF